MFPVCVFIFISTETADKTLYLYKRILVIT